MTDVLTPTRVNPGGLMDMGEAAWAAVAVAAVNMVGSVAMTWLRYYYRAKYGLGEVQEGNGGAMDALTKRSHNL